MSTVNLTNPHALKNIPEAINKRRSEISSDEEAVPPYQEALRKSGYSHTPKFNPPQQSFTRQNQPPERESGRNKI